MNQRTTDHGMLNRLIIDRVFEGDGIDLSLPPEDLEILDTITGRILRVILRSGQPGSDFLRNLTVDEPLIIAVRDGFGQRLFRAVKVPEEPATSPKDSPVRFAFSLIG